MTKCYIGVLIHNFVQVCEYGLHYCKNGEYHREFNKPARYYTNFIVYFEYNKEHRDNDLPAYISNKLIMWLYKGCTIKWFSIKD